MARRPRKRGAKRLKEKRSASGPLEYGVPPQSAERRHNLPTQLTSFVGRELEIAEIKRLLGRMRLLTLTGAGGCGKTRLALQVANGFLDEFPDGVWMADLAPVSNPATVPRAVAAALRIPEQQGRSLRDTLVDSLRSKSLLILLDNCEHLLAPCADLVHTLLQVCPELRILTTSRAPLGVAGEHRWTVSPLSLPDLQPRASVEALLRSEAVSLFVERASAAQSTFAITAGNCNAVGDLCRRLDGIPLAIEMAAAWVRVLTLEEILNRLTDRFQLLTKGDRAVLRRHQTLKAAMDWSYELLSAPERILLARLSVFAGGCTLDAAEVVCSGRDVERSLILGLLAHLVDKSLVVAETSGGQGRYRLLETVRQYGRARLVDAGEIDTIQRRHRDWYVTLAELAASKLRTPEQLTWLRCLETEHDNLRAVLWWSKAKDEDAETRLRLAAALHQFWFIRGYFTEGREWLEGALAAGQNTTAPVRALALSGAGMLAWRQGDPKGGAFLQQSLDLFRELQDRWGAAYALHHLAHVVEEADLGRATDMFEESVALFRELGDRWGIGWSLLCLAHAALLQGDANLAAAPLEESLSLCREVGNMHSLAYVLDHLGAMAGRRGDYDRATVLLEEALDIARQVDDRYHIPFLRYELANVLLARGDVGRALTLFRDSLTLSREVGDKPRLGVFMRGLARAASAQGDHQKTARLIGVVEALRGNYSFERLAYDRADYEQCVTATRSSLGVKDFENLRNEGRTMNLEAAIEYALAPAEAIRPPSPDLTKRAARRRGGVLAPREREVALLITEGRTNREIAAGLSIREGTVEAHVQHILNKLGVNTRAQIAAWIVVHRREAASPPD